MDTILFIMILHNVVV